MVYNDYTNKKVAIKITALSLIYNKTTIPVPRIQAWGPATSNLFNLDLFIIMDFINNISFSNFFEDFNIKRFIRLTRENISDNNIKIIYK